MRLFVVAASFSLSTAMAIQPASGMWSFDGELTDGPGRGIQVDTQGGDLIIITYFGYRADGSAVFYQASGTRNGDEFSGNLLEYKNGRSIGGPSRKGELAQSIGPLRIVFASRTTGTAYIPGEPPVSISRFQFHDHSPRFNRRFQSVRTWYYEANLSEAQITVSAIEGVFSLLGGGCDLFGSYIPSDDGIFSAGNYACDFGTGSYKSDYLSVDHEGVFTAKINFKANGSTEEYPIYYYGTCINGRFGLTIFRCSNQ